MRNMFHHYVEYLSLREEIRKDLPFKVYFERQHGFFPQDVDETTFERTKRSWEEPCCSTSTRREEGGIKSEDSSKPLAFPSIIRFFGLS